MINLSHTHLAVTFKIYKLMCKMVLTFSIIKTHHTTATINKYVEKEMEMAILGTNESPMNLFQCVFECTKMRVNNSDNNYLPCNSFSFKTNGVCYSGYIIGNFERLSEYEKITSTHGINYPKNASKIF